MTLHIVAVEEDVAREVHVNTEVDVGTEVTLAMDSQEGPAGCVGCDPRCTEDAPMLGNVSWATQAG